MCLLECEKRRLKTLTTTNKSRLFFFFAPSRRSYIETHRCRQIHWVRLSIDKQFDTITVSYQNMMTFFSLSLLFLVAIEIKEGEKSSFFSLLKRRDLSWTFSLIWISKVVGNCLTQLLYNINFVLLEEIWHTERNGQDSCRSMKWVTCLMCMYILTFLVNRLLSFASSSSSTSVAVASFFIA